MSPIFPILPVLALAALAGPAQEPVPTAQQAAAEQADATLAPVAFTEQTVCPVSGKALPAGREHFVDYEGQRIATCCKQCLPKVAAQPEQMLFRMELAGVMPASVNEACPVSGEKLEDRKHVVQVANKRFAVCCRKCARKAQADPARYLDALAGRSRQDRCPISGEKAGPRHVAVVDGYPVRTCCEKCLPRVEAEPAQAFAALAEAGFVAEPEKRVCALHPDREAELSHFATLGAQRFRFCSANCRHHFLRKQIAPEKTEGATRGALQFLGG